MTRLREQIITQTPIKEAFAYAADFTNIQDWDPGVAESAQIGEGPVSKGTQFDVLVAFGNRRIPQSPCLRCEFLRWHDCRAPAPR